MMVIFRLNKFINFISAPELPEIAAYFINLLASTEYIFQVVEIVKIVIGA